ncbi:hypothetical protein ABZ456_33075 [Streptomyces sp. NPDC005776]|uniref:hypothetical protein n=1 Tax=Streptomyces sp. NPDC005776 TaxID=3154676 RepID=UPI0033DAB4A6
MMSRTEATRGAGRPAAAMAMVCELIESAQAQAHWCAITAPHLVALVRDSARFENGHLVERRVAGAA